MLSTVPEIIIREGLSHKLHSNRLMFIKLSSYKVDEASFMP